MDGSGSASADVLEWGAEPASRPSWWHRIDPRIPQLICCLGVVPFLGALITDWQVTAITSINQFDDTAVDAWPVRLAGIGVWGVGFIAGMLLLFAATGVALYGPPAARALGRAAGLAIGAGTLVVLLGAVVELSQYSALGQGLLPFRGLPEEDIEVTLGPGAYAAFAAVLLLVVALALVRSPVTAAPAGPLLTAPPQAPEPPGTESSAPPPQPAPTGGDPEVTVAPAEPFARPVDGHEWR